MLPKTWDIISPVTNFIPWQDIWIVQPVAGVQPDKAVQPLGLGTVYDMEPGCDVIPMY